MQGQRQVQITTVTQNQLGYIGKNKAGEHMQNLSLGMLWADNTSQSSALRFICHLFAQSTSLLRSVCNSRTSSGYLTLSQSFVSSANLYIFLTMPLSRSWMQMRKSSGPRTLPCGTPDVSGVQLLKVWLMKPFGSILLTSYGSIGLHYLG